MESNYIVICKILVFKYCFPQYYKSDVSKYGYLEVFFEGPFDFEITRVDCSKSLDKESTEMHHSSSLDLQKLQELWSSRRVLDFGEMIPVI